MFALDITVYAEKPMKDIHNFVGTIKHVNENGAVHEDALNVENTLWANTVVASGSAVGMVIYTGRETRSAMNASKAHSKVGLIDIEINNLTKVLFGVVVILAFVMVCLKGFSGPWFRYLFRFILLFSYIIPLSLRVNLDMAKLVYAVFISKDKDINGTVVRSSTIPEELGRISYLLSDKTGTLTQNKMIFKKLHLGSVAFTTESYEDVNNAMKTHLLNAYGKTDITETSTFRQSIMNKVQQAVEAIAICHNVTPVYENENETSNAEDTEADLQQKQEVSYQASSPDEVALVSWADCVGVKLIQRDLHGMQLKSPTGDVVAFKILHLFPFTSENKRMGIIVQREDTKEIILYVKGADSVLIEKVQYNDWLEEECANLAREGLRTLVVAKKVLTEKQYADFDKEYSLAKLSLQDRAGRTAAVISVLENNLQVLCVTGVEDSLQVDVPVTLELLKNAGVKIWMLTGDKLETAICISKSSGLIGRNQSLYVFNSVLNRAEARNQLNNLSRKRDHALIITGQSLKICLEEYEEEFADLASNCPAVVCCRCSPEQKAQIVALIKKYHRPARVAAVGDGGNDVSMIQAADAGIGIVGKEGRQASLAADFSITQFSHLSRLMLVHGRYCYKRSCALSQFVMHRGLIISTMQAIFSCVFYFASVSLYQGMLMVMYSTIYTNLPVFSLVMDKDVKPANLLIFPELYKELSKGRSMSYKTFCLWFIASVYQGAVIMYLALALFDADFIHIVSITFTALIFNELIMVALTIHTWHWVMLIAEIVSLGIYAISLFVMKGYFDVNFVQSSSFWWKTAIITAVACMPLYLAKYLRRRMAPPTYAKLS
uniref:Phospholipid-transporting ATPase n=1 Tax=Romanomermis culicivorax TaxID=13658 RepID=A0A915HRS1_ROMCU